jgi:hypothetical protein
VAARVWTGIRSQAAHLRRLSVVFASELRLKIVIELYMREMSPKQFHEEFGGGSLTRVDNNFKELAKHGWLRLIRSEGPGGKRRGGVEHFYRATELAYFDYETWELLPYSIRVAFSWNAFKQIAQRVREAMEALTFQARPARHLTSTSLLLDQLGRERVTEALAAEFAGQFEEQEDARRRASHSGEKLFRTSTVLIAFELPAGAGANIGPSLVENQSEPLIPFPVRLSKVFGDPVCVQIVREANLREISAPSFNAEFGSDTSEGIRRRIKMLVRIGLLKKVREQTGGRRRGAREHFYRASGPAILRDDGPWAKVPESLKGTNDWLTFERLSKQVKEAMVAGSFDARADRWLAWSLLSLDQQGWEKVTATMEALLAFILEEQERAQIRMAESGEKPVAITVALAAFESPMDSAREP